MAVELVEVGNLAKWKRGLTPLPLARLLVRWVRQQTGASKVAVLYCSMHGPYIGMDDTLCWPVLAQYYRGPWPVIAHPPCGPWGRFRWKCTRQDASLGIAAMEQVHRYGGIVEQPWRSVLFIKHARDGARVVTINQCDYGHPSRKRTDLYINLKG